MEGGGGEMDSGGEVRRVRERKEERERERKGERERERERGRTPRDVKGSSSLGHSICLGLMGFSFL